TFSRDAFPGKEAPQVIYLGDTPCEPDIHDPALAFSGSQVVVDGLDRNASTGAVVWSVGECQLPVLRISGSDNVFRGIIFDGSQTAIARANGGKPGTPQVDTVAITGTEARRNKIEKSVILGPTCGDAVSVDNGAGQGAGAGSAENVVLDSELTRAADRGV